VAQPRIAVVVNPRSRARARLRARTLARLRERLGPLAELETRGDEQDAARIAALIGAEPPEVLVAAGGDGTVALALRALLEAKAAERTALAILPLGTGNNAARSFGLRALGDGEAALALALEAIASGPRRRVDVGLVAGRPFLGAVAIGMDADVLALRNRVHRRIAPRGVEGGWGLYLAGFAANLFAGPHGGTARLWLDGVRETCALYNLAVVNAPVYAGPFRFDGENDCADGRLDVHAVASAREYVSEYPRAWLRHLSAGRGGRPKPSPLLRRAREVRVEFERPVAAEADGEEIGAAASFELRALPGALRLCTPASGTAATGSR
jgi:diacylglycerol kinase family enzyme